MVEPGCRRAAAVSWRGRHAYMHILFLAWCILVWTLRTGAAQEKKGEIHTLIAVAGEKYELHFKPNELLDDAFVRFLRDTPWPFSRHLLESLARTAFRQAVEERSVPRVRLVIRHPRAPGVECLLDSYSGDDFQETLRGMLAQCGMEAGDGEGLGTATHWRLVSVLSMDGGEDLNLSSPDPGKFRVWEGERLRDKLPPFLADAGVADASHTGALLRRAEERLRETLLGSDVAPALWSMPPQATAAGYEPDQAFALRRGGSAPAWAVDYGVVQIPSTGFCNNHYYHVVECFLGLFAWSREHRVPGREVVQVVVVHPAMRMPTHDFFASALFPEASIAPETPASLSVAVVAAKAGLGDNIPQRPIDTNRALEHSAVVESFWFPEFLAAVYAAAGASPRPRPASPGEVRAVYVRRAMSLRELGDEDLARLASVMLEEHGVALEVVRFEAMTVEEQVRLSARVDLMVGVHGNGLTNLLWMPPHGAVLELFAADWHFYDYQMLSEISGHLYSGVQEGNPHPYRRGSQRESAYGFPVFAPGAIDWVLVSSELRFLLSWMMG